MAFGDKTFAKAFAGLDFDRLVGQLIGVVIAGGEGGGQGLGTDTDRLDQALGRLIGAHGLTHRGDGPVPGAGGDGGMDAGIGQDLDPPV